MSGAGGDLPASGVGEAARGRDGKALSRSAEAAAPEEAPEFGQTVLDHGGRLTADVLWRLRERVKADLYREDKARYRNENLTLPAEKHYAHDAELRAMLGTSGSYLYSRASHQADKEILTAWVARRAFAHGKHVRLARRQMIWELRTKYAKAAQIKDLAECLSYLMCFRIGLPILPSYEMPQGTLVPEEHFPAEDTPDYAGPEAGAPHREYLAGVLSIRQEIELDVEHPGPFYSEGVDLRWNSWSTYPLHNFSPYARRFDVFAEVQARQQDQGRPVFTIGGIEAQVYRRHPICLFIERYFRFDSGILDLAAIVQSHPGVRNAALRARFTNRVIAALEEGLEVLAPFAAPDETPGTVRRKDVEAGSKATRAQVEKRSPAFYELFAPDSVGTYNQFSAFLKQPLGPNDPNTPGRNVDWGAFGPLLSAATAELVSEDEAVRSHLMKKAEDPLFILLRDKIFPGLNRWSVGDAIGYVLLAFGLILGIAAILATGGSAAPWLVGAALALDGLGIAMSAQDLITVIGNAGQMEFEKMFVKLKPALAAYQADTSVGWAIGMLIFDIVMLGLPAVGRNLMPGRAPGTAAGAAPGAGSRPDAGSGLSGGGTPPPRPGQGQPAPGAITQGERSVPEPPPAGARDGASSGAGTDPPARGRADDADGVDARSVEAGRTVDDAEALRAREETLNRQAHEILYGPEGMSEARQRATDLTETWADRLVNQSRQELEAIAADPATLREMPPELRAIFTNPDEQVSSFWRHNKTGNLQYSVRSQGGGRGLVFPDAAVARNRRAGAGFRQPATGSPADRLLREIWQETDYAFVKEIEGVRHTFYFDKRGRAWFHEKQLDRGHIQTAVSKGIELHTRIIESLRRGQPESVIRERLKTQTENFNKRLSNLTPEARSFNRMFGGAETQQYGDVLDTARPGLARWTSGTEDLANGLSDQARKGYDEIFDDSWYLASLFDDPRAARGFDLSDPAGRLSRSLDEEARLRSLFAEDLVRLRTELLEDGLSKSAADQIISLCRFVD